MSAPILETRHMRMPRIGLGTWPMKGAECQQAVEGAIALGYRHVDTAEMYGNEDAVGAGIAATGLRDQIFLTTKVWYDKPKGEQIRRAFEASLKRLATDYVDLFLIHWPSPELDLPDALRMLARLKEEGLARAVGVSNFPAGLFRRALESGLAPIACIQVEYHVLLSQAPLLELARAHDVGLTAYSPLGKGEVPSHPEVQRIAVKHGVTGGQVALAWLLAQPNVCMVPKAASPARQAENLAAAELRLDAEDIAALDALPKANRFVNPSFAPSWAD